MPYYDFVCKECSEIYEVCERHPPLDVVECKLCGGRLERLFSPPTVIQKGYKESDARFNRGKGK